MGKKTLGAVVFLFTGAGLLSITALFVTISAVFFCYVSKTGFLPIAIASEWAPSDGKYGVLPMVAGSLVTAALSVLFAIPISLGIIVQMHSNSNIFSRFLRILLRFMSGIPTVVYSLCGIFILIPIFRAFTGGSGYNIFTVSSILCFLILPTMTLTADSALHSFINGSNNPMLTSDSLGIKREKGIIYIALYAQRKAALTGIVLSFSRAIGDTLVALMLSGNAPVLPDSLFSSVRTLAGHISLLAAAEITPQAEFTLFLSGFLLFLTALVLSFIVRALKGR